MIKFQKKVLTLAVAAGLAGLAGVAQASSVGGMGTAAAPTPWPALTGTTPNITVAKNTDSFTVAAESLVVNYDIDLDPAVNTPAGTALGGKIVWIPTFGLNSGDLITFTFTGGLWMSNNAKLIASELAADQVNTLAVDINGDGDNLDTTVEVASNFGSVDTTNGVSSITMRINNGLNLPEGLVLKLTYSATDDYPTIRIPKGATGSVSVAVTATNSAGTTIGAAAASNVLFDIAKQVDFAVSSKATSQANVSDATGGSPTPRNHFVDETFTEAAPTTGDSSLLNSVAQFTIYNGTAGTNTVEDKIVFTGGGTDTFVIDVTPGSGGLSALSTTAAASFIELGTVAANDANVPLVADTTNGKFSVTLTEAQLDAIATSVTDIAVLTVKGDTPIDERTWTMSAKLARSTEGTVNYAGGESHVWTTNGTVLQAPFWTLVSGYVPRFYITNTSSSPVSYTITIQSDPDSSPAGAAGAVTGGTINAKSGVLLKGPDIATGQRGTAIFTAAAPCNVIEGVFQVRNQTSGDFDSIPLLKPTACNP